MPPVRPIALAVSDLHLTLKAPACRAETDWLKVQERYLEQVNLLANNVYNVPVLCAGDVFDRWNPPPELIRFALEHLPDKMICVPGQHDLPNHRLDHMHRSGYGVLKEAGKIIDLTKKLCYVEKLRGDFVVKGFGWGVKISEPHYESRKMVNTPQIALIHKYCWTKGKSYPGAPEDCEVAQYRKQLKDYDVAIFGDNHKSFQVSDRRPPHELNIVNVGGFIRRKSDELDHEPCVAIIHSDGSIKRRKLDVSLDKFHKGVTERHELPVDMSAFIDLLEEIGEHGLNFEDAVKTYLTDADVDAETRQLILSALERK